MIMIKKKCRGEYAQLLLWYKSDLPMDLIQLHIRTECIFLERAVCWSPFHPMTCLKKELFIWITFSPRFYKVIFTLWLSEVYQYNKAGSYDSYSAFEEYLVISPYSKLFTTEHIKWPCIYAICIMLSRNKC